MVKKRRKTTTNHANDGDDPLGRLTQEFRVSLKGVLLLSGLIGFVGLACIAFSFANALRMSLILLVAGTAALLGAVVVLMMNVFNVGRRLEVRKRGIRYVEMGMEHEFLWKEISRVEVERTDHTDLGVATLRRRSADSTSGSGLLTKTEWKLVIHGHDGATMRLPHTFLRIVPNPRKLIAHLRLHAGIDTADDVLD